MGKVAPIEEDNQVEGQVVEVKAQDEEPHKEWGNPIEFLMTLLSFAVGLGNVWRYEYNNNLKINICH